MNKRKFVVISLILFLVTPNIFGEDKWQKGKKYSELFSPMDSTIYKVTAETEGNYSYLYRGKLYCSLIPLLSDITRTDPFISPRLLSMYKLTGYTTNIFALTNVVSSVVFFLSSAVFLVSFDVNCKICPVIGVSFLTMFSSFGLVIISSKINSWVGNDIRDHYNEYINENNKNIGLKFSYHF